MTSLALWVLMAMMQATQYTVITGDPCGFPDIQGHLNAEQKKCLQGMDSSYGKWITQKGEPMDVPAIQVWTKAECGTPGAMIPPGCPEGQMCMTNLYACQRVQFTCRDKSRVLLTDESGKKHCIRFER